jgi:hypothetical protein
MIANLSAESTDVGLAIDRCGGRKLPTVVGDGLAKYPS